MSSAQAGHIANEQDWALSQLYDLGIKPTPDNVQALIGWAHAEGGFGHKNPLNTTKSAPGAKNFNGVGVKTYPDWDTAIKATSATLKSYPDVLAQLKKGNSMDIAKAIANSPWVDGHTGAHPAYQALIAGSIASVKKLSPKQLLHAILHGPDPDTPTSSVTDLPVISQAKDAVELAGNIWGTLSDPKTWLRVLYFVGGLALGVLAIKQLATAAGSA